MATVDELQKEHEARLAALLAELAKKAPTNGQFVGASTGLGANHKSALPVDGKCTLSSTCATA